MEFIKGIKTSLYELTTEDAQEVIDLRNNPKYTQFLYQKPISLGNQIKWLVENKLKNDNFNFKIVNLSNEFKGIISLYNLNNKRAEFGRYISTNPIHAIESEYLLLKFAFESLGLEEVYCQTNIENIRVWKQHIKLGFKTLETREVFVGSEPQVKVQAVFQQISAPCFKEFDYSSLFNLINLF